MKSIQRENKQKIPSTTQNHLAEVWTDGEAQKVQLSVHLSVKVYFFLSFYVIFSRSKLIQVNQVVLSHFKSFKVSLSHLESFKVYLSHPKLCPARNL